MIFCFSISSFAFSEQINIPAGNYQFSENLDFSQMTIGFWFDLRFKVIGEETQYVFFHSSLQDLYIAYNTEYTPNNEILVYSNGHWIDEKYRFITVTDDFTRQYSDEPTYESVLEFIETNMTDYPNTLNPTFWENVTQVWTSTLTASTIIITWLLANQIALCGLYLYILIACIGIGKRFVKT